MLTTQKKWKNYHMKFVRVTMLLLGIWPIKLKGLKKWIYELYFWTTFIYYVLFIFSGFTLAILTWTNNYLITANSMGIVIEYASNAYKVLLFKSETIKALIREIADKEQKLFESNDEQFIKIYKTNAEWNKKIVLFYTIMGTTGISLYFITPLLANMLMPLGINEETGIKNHYFIVYSWFPFDANKHYWAAYLIQFMGCLFGYSYIVHCGGFYLSLLNFVTSQLKILQHVFANFSKYAEKYQKHYKINEEQAQCFLLKLLLSEHLDIIDFVKRLNNIIKLFTLFNFLISSFQLSLVAYQIFKLPPLQQVAVFSYFITLSTQLFLTYHAAHTIAQESENIAASIFKGNWDKYSSRVVKILQMICMRAQKPIMLTIGPLADVRVTSLFQIFKALYSYVCLFMKI